MMEETFETRLAAYGFSLTRSDYVLENVRCEIRSFGPRHLRVESCVSDDERINEKMLRKYSEGVERRILVGFEEFDLARIGTVDAGARKERYIEARRFDISSPIDLSLLNAYTLGIDLEPISPERPYEGFVDPYVSSIASAVLLGEPRNVYVPKEKIDDPAFHVSILRYTPSYPLKFVSLDTNARRESKAYIRVFIGPHREFLETLYAKYLKAVGKPEALRDFVDAILYAVSPKKDLIAKIADAATVLFIAKHVDFEKAAEELDEDLARSLGKISNSVSKNDVRLIALLVSSKGFEKEAIEGADGNYELVSSLISVGYSKLNRGDYKTPIRIAKAVLEYDPELSLAFMLDIAMRRPESRDYLKRELYTVFPLLDYSRMSEAGLTTLLYLADMLKIPDEKLLEIAPKIVKRACEIYERTYSEKRRRIFEEERPVLPILFSLMFKVLPPPKELKNDKDVAETIRNILYTLRSDLTYARYELSKVFEGYVRNVGIPPLLMIPAGMVSEYIEEILKRVASEEYRRYLPVPRLERISSFAPELEEEYVSINKNIKELRAQIMEYLKKERERKGPGEGEGDEIV